MRLERKLAVITGAATGIGAAGADLFAREGAALALIDHEADILQARVESIRAAGGVAHGIVADLSQAGEVRRAMAEAVDLLGGLDIIWCNAGIHGPTQAEDIPLEEYQAAVALNQTGMVLTSSEAVPHLRARGGGSIIVTSSTSGLVGSLNAAVYSTTKFAVIGWAKSLALRVAADGIRVNALCPGLTATETARRAVAAGLGGMLDSVPMARMGEPAEVAQAALWLASDRSSYVTGITLPVDGGFTAR